MRAAETQEQTEPLDSTGPGAEPEGRKPTEKQNLLVQLRDEPSPENPAGPDSEDSTHITNQSSVLPIKATTDR